MAAFAADTVNSGEASRRRRSELYQMGLSDALAGPAGPDNNRFAIAVDHDR
jgi:hypothetical protein